MRDMNYEMAWRFLKKLVGQFKRTQTNNAKDKTASVSDRNYTKGGADMAGIILEEMWCIEKGDEADE